MPNTFHAKLANFDSTHSTQVINQIANGELSLDQASIFAFMEQPRRDRNQGQTGSSTTGWQNTQPSPPPPPPPVTSTRNTNLRQHHHRIPPPPTPQAQNLPPPPVPPRRDLPPSPRTEKIAYTGIVVLRTKTMYLSPLRAAREAEEYMGPLKYSGRDLTPIDHYSGAALDAMLGTGEGQRLLQLAKNNPQQAVRLGQPANAILGGHRVPGIRPSSQGHGHKTFDPSLQSTQAKKGFWDSAGHRELVTRLGESMDGCVGFAVLKNGMTAGQHKVYFVSRLNTAHFFAYSQNSNDWVGMRGMTSAFGNKILTCLGYHIR